MDAIAHPRYTGSALPGNAETVVLFSTVVAFPGKDFSAMAGIKRFLVDLKNDQAGTINFFKSQNRGVTWTNINSQAVAIAAANTSNKIDYAVEEFMDWKVEWLNGATPQGTFIVDMALTDERSPLV